MIAIKKNMLIALTPLGCMALAVFFFLTPGYEPTGLASAAMALIVSIFSLSKHTAEKTGIFMSLSALAYLASCFISDASLHQHLYELAMGLLVAVAAYRCLQIPNIPVRYLLAALALPLIMHLLFFLPKIPAHLLQDNAGFIEKFESLRTSAQIGSKLLGQALIMLVPLLYYFLCMAHSSFERMVGGAFFCLSCLCLALLDSRASYLAFLMGIILASHIRRVMLKRHSDSHVAFMLRAMQIRRLVIILTILCSILAAMTGWHRLNRVDAAVEAALHRQDYISWITPLHWVKEFCPSTTQECLVENSIYLRTSWVLYGLETIAEHPWRIQPSRTPLETALKESYPELSSRHAVYTDFHSGLIDVGFNYGVPGMLMFLALLLYPMWKMFRQAYDRSAPDYLPLLVCLWGCWVTRSIIDGMGINFYYTAWAYAGFVLSMTQDRRRMLRHAL